MTTRGTEAETGREERRRRRRTRSRRKIRRSEEITDITIEFPD